MTIAATMTEHEIAALQSLPAERVAADLRGRLERNDAAFRLAVQEYDAGRRHVYHDRWDLTHLSDTFRMLATNLDGRRQLRERLAAVDPDAKFEPTDDGHEIFHALIATRRAGEVRSHARSLWHALTNQHVAALARGGHEIASRMARVQDGEPTAEHSGPLTAAHGQVAESRDAIATLRYDVGQKAAQAQQAVLAAGGAAVLVVAARSALQLQDRHDAATPAWGSATALEAEAASLDAALKRVDRSSPLSVALAAKSKAAKAAAAKARTEAAEQAEAALSKHIDAVARAEPAAVARIKALAAEVPEAFPAGFGDALGTLVLDDDQLSGAFSAVVKAARPAD